MPYLERFIHLGMTWLYIRKVKTRCELSSIQFVTTLLQRQPKSPTGRKAQLEHGYATMRRSGAVNMSTLAQSASIAVLASSLILAVGIMQRYADRPWVAVADRRPMRQRLSEFRRRRGSRRLEIPGHRRYGRSRSLRQPSGRGLRA
jgi:hypothetical protein